MTIRRVALRTFVSLVGLVALFASSFGTARAGVVVYGNLGASGTDALDGTSTDFGPSETVKLFAQGFTTGSSASFLTVQSVTVGIFATNSGTSQPRTVSIYTSTGSGTAAVPDSVLYTSATTMVGNTGKYTFNFAPVTLSANTDYWIVPEAPGSWYFNFDNTAPSAQNSSGYAYLGTKRTLDNASWINASSAFSISIVPEPNSVMFGLVGLAAATCIVRRRSAGRTSGSDQPITADQA